MRRIYLVIAITLIATSIQAQYKKASFFNKAGRTYGVGAAARFMGNGSGGVPGFYYGFGRDQGKRIFHWFDLEILLPIKYRYTSIDQYDETKILTVTGKSGISFAYRYNYAYYLTKNEHEDSKFKPFVTAGINAMVFIGTSDNYQVSPSGIPEKTSATDAFYYGANAGLGAVYALSEKIGLKMIGGYNFEGQYQPSSFGNGSNNLYKIYANHPYITFGLRFLIKGD